MLLWIRPFQCKVRLASFLGFCSLITLLSLNSGPAQAEWVPVGGNDEQGVDAYVDPDTLRRKGNLVKMWQLLNYKTVQTVAGNSFLSIKSQTKYDCAEERVRILSQSFFSEQMGSGHVIRFVSGLSTWSPVEPASFGKSLWSYACNKK